jgi:hypothetical protein
MLSRIGSSQNSTAHKSPALDAPAVSKEKKSKQGSKRTRSPETEGSSRIDKKGIKKITGATTIAKNQAPETPKPIGASTHKKTSDAATTAKKRQVPETQKPTRASTNKKSSATDIDATYEVDEFLQKDKSNRKMLVAWKHHTDLTWEPIKMLKKDLGPNYEALVERMKEEDDTPLSSLMGSSVRRRT